MRNQPELEVVGVPVGNLKAYEGNAKKHTREQLDAVEASINEFGFANPVLAWHDEKGEAVIIAGHGRVEAAKALGMDEVPTVFLDHLDDGQRRALTLADNQTTMMTGWDMDTLKAELDALGESFDMGDFGFDLDYKAGGVIDSLLSDGFVSQDFGETADTFSVTFEFDKEHEDDLKGFISTYGKEPLVDAILTAVEDGR